MGVPRLVGGDTSLESIPFSELDDIRELIDTVDADGVFDSPGRFSSSLVALLGSGERLVRAMLSDRLRRVSSLEGSDERLEEVILSWLPEGSDVSRGRGVGRSSCEGRFEEVSGGREADSHSLVGVVPDDVFGTCVNDGEVVVAEAAGGK